MSRLVVNGGICLNGETKVIGAKNSVLPLLAATFLCEGQCILHNCPDLSDVRVSLDILKCLGCKCQKQEDTIIVTSNSNFCCEIPETLMREMRSSIVFMGAVAAKCGSAVMSLPGGCELGPRPIDLHIDALKRLGAVVECSGGKLYCAFKKGAKGTDIHLKFPSVGATENIILAAVTAQGTTVIYNAAREPEISDLCLFLNKCGADIKGFGTDVIVINGKKMLKGNEYTVMPDRIVSATYMFAAAACKGDVRINGVVTEHIIPIISCLKDIGCEVKSEGNSVRIKTLRRLNSFDTVSTQPFPGFPTDAGPPLVALAATLNGTGVFIENIFDNRFRYIDELVRLGAEIKTVGKVAVITGVNELKPADLIATDLRGGAAMVIGAMCSNGVSKIGNIEFIDRGYERIEDAFNQLGADIKRC